MINTADKQSSPIWAILPVKRVDQAKQRLSDALSSLERQELFRHMLDDVLKAISGARSLDGLMVVTQDPEFQELAERRGARVSDAAADDGQSAAVAAAATMLSAESINNIITLPGDVPLLAAAEIDSVCNSLRTSPALTIVPSRDKTGTNSIACSPPGVISFMFGEQSFSRHLRAAREEGIPTQVLRPPGMALDIDVEADLVELLDHNVTTATQRFLLSSGIARRLEQHGRVAHRATGTDGLAIQ